MHSSVASPLLLLLFATSFYVQVVLAVAGDISGSRAARENPFSPKGYLIRYWNKTIINDLSMPLFLLDKASPLTATESADFSKLAGQNLLSTRLDAFCTKADLFCFPALSPTLEKHEGNVNFASYQNKNFTNYGTDQAAGVHSFKNYSIDGNVVVDNFRRYSRDSTGVDDQFTNYATKSNVVDQSFNSYGTTGTGGEGQFSNYNGEVNVPTLRFAAYSDDSNGRKQSFTTYTDEANSGDQPFTSYGKNSNGAADEFISYARDANTLGSTFTNYAEAGNGANDTFISYGSEANVPENNFKNYGAGGNAAVQNFKNYRDGANAGDDNFQSYGKKSNDPKMDFENYGKSVNEGTDKFTGYGQDASNPTVNFKIYGINNTFKDYAKKGVEFASYINQSSSMVAPLAENRRKVNKWVEPGKFFREAMLKTGRIMPMPDIRDKMPKRSFLPRSIISKLPFSTSKLGELKRIFHANDNSSMEKILTNSLNECERPPSPGETKRCVASSEDMIDFATAVLGRNVSVRTTENTRGSGGDILIGEVKGINGGNVTKSVSCHQSLFPYMLYYCHSVPKVRVYEADILDPETKSKINHGVAICHLDTSAWSLGHGAFVALGSGPGKIEVCHWIFENDMTWTVAD